MRQALFPTLDSDDELLLVYQPPVLPRLAGWCARHQPHLVCRLLGMWLLEDLRRAF